MAMLLRLCPKRVHNTGVIEVHKNVSLCPLKRQQRGQGYSFFFRRRSREEVSQRPPPIVWIS